MAANEPYPGTQAVLRAIALLKAYTPIDNLYLCGAGAHPGGGVTGAPSYNAAREILKALKRNRR